MVALREPRTPEWLASESIREQIEDELRRIRDSNLETPLTKIMLVFEGARRECRDLREVSAELRRADVSCRSAAR